MADQIQPKDGEDVILWPDGFWCHREDLHTFTHRSDDYEQIPFLSARWHQHMRDEGIE